MSYKFYKIPFTKKDVDHIKDTTKEEMLKAKVIEDKLLKESLAEIEEKEPEIPIDQQIKQTCMANQLNEWEKNPDKPTNKTLKDYDKQYT